jgi:hypothetical protein
MAPQRRSSHRPHRSHRSRRRTQRPWRFLGALFLFVVALIATAFVLNRIRERRQMETTAGVPETLALPADAPTAVLARATERSVYPYSVIPGGVDSVAELKAAIDRDPVVAEHYREFDVSKARVERLEAPKLAHVSYRIGNDVYWTRKQLVLPAGERVITDGKHIARTRCGNQLADTPAVTSPAEPAASVLDTPVAPKPGGVMPAPALVNTVAATHPATSPGGSTAPVSPGGVSGSAGGFAGGVTPAGGAGGAGGTVTPDAGGKPTPASGDGPAPGTGTPTTGGNPGGPSDGPPGPPAFVPPGGPGLPPTFTPPGGDNPFVPPGTPGNPFLPPGTPGGPNTPDGFTPPGTPGDPGNPGNPGNPGTPGNPENPLIPNNPQQPDVPTPVPEPSSVMLMLMGLGGVAARLRRR